MARQYVLVTIDGQPLPAVLNAGQSDTTRILWATISLDADGKAYTADHWRRVYPPNQTEEATRSLEQEYRISGDNITVGFFTPCQDTAACIGNKTGKITDSTLTLSFTDPGAPVYFYELMPVD